ncbi:MAG: hypothetical protein QXS66_08800 [Thermoproteota archaeon]
MKESLSIKLPPEGTLIRDFILTSLSYLREKEPRINLEWLEDDVKVNASPLVLETAFRSLYGESAELAKNKVKKIRLGIIPNDKNAFSKLFGVKKDKVTGTYLDVMAKLLEKSSKNIKLSTLSKLERHARGIRFGDGGIVALGFLVAEKYEYGLEFGRLNFRLKFNIELDEAWYPLVLAGFVWCISTRLGEDTLFTFFPEDFIKLEQMNTKIFNVIKRAFGGLSILQEKINDTLCEVESIGEPFPATVLLLSLRLSKIAKDNGSLSIIGSEDFNSLPLSLCRLRRTPKTFVIIDKRRAEISRVIKFSSSLAMKSDKSVNNLERICRRTIQLASGFRPRPDEPDFTVYNRFTTLLLQAIEQAYSIYEVVYYGSRYGLLSRTLGEDIIEIFSTSPVL